MFSWRSAIALEIGLIGLERAAAPGPGAVERILGAGQHLVHGAGMARRGDASDRHRGGDRAGGCLHHLVADAGDQAVGRDQQIIRRAIVEDDAELVAGHAPEMVLAAQLRVHALGDRGDDLVGDVEAVGLVDAAEIIDRRQQEAAGGAQLDGFLDGGLENLGQAVAIELAGQGIEARKLGQLLFPLVALVDDAHHTMGESGLALRSREPAAGVLDPDRLRGRSPQRILHLVGNAGARIAQAAAHDRVEARGTALRIDQSGIGFSARERRRIERRQHRVHIRAPRQRIGVDPPLIGNFADGGENRIRVDRHGTRICGIAIDRCAHLGGLPARPRGTIGRQIAAHPVDHVGPIPADHHAPYSSKTTAGAS